MEMACSSNSEFFIRVPLPQLQQLLTKLLPLSGPSEISIDSASYSSLADSFLQLLSQLDKSAQLSFLEQECPWLPPKANLKRILQNQPWFEQSQDWDYIQNKADFRVEASYKSGGLSLTDPAIVSKIRSVGTEVLKQLGKKLLSGDFNLTHISFPIRCMQANTALHNTLNTFQMAPLYLNRAVAVMDYLERLKLVIVSILASFVHTSTFEKPLNPILGETLYGEMEDGTEMFAEQSSHHPPVSHFYVKSNGYKAFGYFNYTAKAGLNSVTVTNIGKRTFEFHDGYRVSLTCPEEVFSGTFFGTMRHESLGSIKVTDSRENSCVIVFGNVKKKPTDYLRGTILNSAGIEVSRLEGTYLGYLEWDGVRYWDARHVRPFPINYLQVLASDSETRKDICVLRTGNVDLAQRAKEELEEIQRRDRKLRDKFHK